MRQCLIFRVRLKVCKHKGKYAEIYVPQKGLWKEVATVQVLSGGELTLATRRLDLKPLTSEDLDIIQSVWCDPQVMYYVGDVTTPEDVIQDMPQITSRGAGGRVGIWCISRKDTGQKIGNIVLLPVSIDEDDTDWSQVVPDAYPKDEIEVGYQLVPDAWGQGYASEACKRIIRFAFEKTDLPSVVANTDPDHTASKHVLEKCGMRFVGLKRAYGYDDQAWYELTRREWEEEDCM